MYHDTSPLTLKISILRCIIKFDFYLTREVIYLSAMDPNSSFYAVIIGLGSGTGAAHAHCFAKAYTVVLLARNAASNKLIIDSIQASALRSILWDFTLRIMSDCIEHHLTA
jgi:hypothetical protein